MLLLATVNVSETVMAGGNGGGRSGGSGVAGGGSDSCW